VAATAAPTAAPAKEAVVATIERQPVSDLKPPEAKPAPAAAPEPVKAREMAAAAAPAARPAPAKPAAKTPESKTPTAAPDAKKGSPMGLFVGIGVVVVALIAAALFVPSMLAKKSASPAPTVVVAAHTAPAAPATPPAAPAAAPSPTAGVVATPVTPDSNALAAAGGNTLVDPNAAPHPRRAHPRVTAHHDTEVPF
jgi:hypothetical protein